MPQAIPVAISVGTAIAAKGASGWVLAGYLAAGAALSAGASYLINQRSLKSAADAMPNSTGLLVNTRATEDRVRVVYGTRKVGGTFVDMNGAGDDNADLWAVLSLGEGECEGIAQVGGIDQIFLGDDLWNTFGGNVSCWFHAGAPGQAADANLTAALPSHADPYRNRCYLALKLHWSQDHFMGLPTITVVLKGKKVYDFRDETWKYSANPVLCRYDYMTNTRYGMAIPAGEIDIPSYTAAANYCDAKGVECHFVLDGEIEAEDVLDSIDILYRGFPSWFNGKHYLHYADLNYETSVMELTDEHVARGDDGSWLIAMSEPSGLRRPDGYKVLYTDPDKGYVTNHVLVGATQGYIPELSLPACTSRELAAIIGTYQLESAWLDRQVSGTFRDDCLQLEPGDVVVGTFSALGVSSQYFRVAESGRASDGTVPLTLLYESPALYNDVVDLVEDEVYECSLPNPKAEPPGVGNVVVVEEAYAYRLRTEIRLKVSFDKPAGYPWLSHVEVWQSFDGESWTYMFPVETPGTGGTGGFELGPVEEGKTYHLRIKSVSIHGRRQADANDYKATHLVAGIASAAPASLVSLDAIVSGNAVNLWANKLPGADIELYEYRLGLAWNGAIFLASMLSPNLSLQGVKPGTHTFLCNVRGTNGMYAATPRSQTIALIDPPDGWTLQATESLDYTTGTHDNTEHVTYSEEDHLKCSHTGGALAGTWTSAVIDRGTSARRMVYALADVVLTGAGTTWGDIAPSPMTWAELGVDRTWRSIFELPAGPALRLSLLYGDDSPPVHQVGRMEILYAVVTGRYFQVKVDITDPSPEVYTLLEALQLKFCQAA